MELKIKYWFDGSGVAASRLPCSKTGIDIIEKEKNELMDQVLLLADSIVVKLKLMELKLKNWIAGSGVAASRLHCGEAAPAGQGDQHCGQCLHQGLLMMMMFVLEIRAMMIMVLMDEDDKEINTVFGIRLVIVLSFMNNFILRYWEMLKKSSHT